MPHLPNGCYYSDLTVNPKNWQSGGAGLLKRNWYIQYKFYDPNRKDQSEYQKGKLMILKKMNRFETLAKRREATILLINYEKHRLDDLSYNPIAKKQGYVTHVKADTTTEILIVQRSTPFIIALEYALERHPGVYEYKKDIRSALHYITIAARKLGYDKLPIYDIRVDHISNILEYCQRNKINWTNKRYNKVKGELGGLFRYLIEKNAASSNAPRDVKNLPVKETIRQELTPEELKKVEAHLLKNNRQFYNFMIMFRYSGGRELELMQLKGKDVDLVNQSYKCEVRKGGTSDIVRPIALVALPFWTEQMKDCNPDDYVFSKKLLPGPQFISPLQIRVRWRKYVKKPLNITADFYSLKHTNTGEIVDKFGIEAAAFQNGHASTEMVKKRYGKRAHEKKLHDLLKG